tara:strand:- start:307 stop:627 length:321 start_codon:yes stop_codon:yes gene_type:complete
MNDPLWIWQQPEGEQLNVSSVRSSLARRLGLNEEGRTTSRSKGRNSLSDYRVQGAAHAISYSTRQTIKADPRQRSSAPKTPQDCRELTRSFGAIQLTQITPWQELD